MNSLQPMRVLSDAQIDQINGAAEEILQDTGFCVRHEDLLRRARIAGARVDEANGRVRLPKPLLRELIVHAPAKYIVRNVLGGEYEIGCGTPGIFAITNDPWIVDYETRAVRHPCLEDVRRHTIIAQRLDRVVCMSCMDYPVTEADDGTSSLRALEQHLLLHAKHNIALPVSLERFNLWVEIATILNRGNDPAGSRLLTCGVPVLSPLCLTRNNAEMLLRACRHEFPILPTICPMAGTTSPFTIASTLLLAHCENLFMAAMTQLIRPGNPFLYAMGPSVSEMRAGENRYYTLDKVLWKIGGVQLAKSCHLPCSAECGGTMTHRYDPQNGAEGILFMLSARASGADVLAGLGSCYNASGMCAEMMIIQEEWLRAAEFLCRGINTEEHVLGIPNIQQAGPGAHFLTDELTLEFARGGAFFDPVVLDYAGGYRESPSLLERAHQRVEELVGDHQSPVPAELRETLQQYFRRLHGTHRMR